MIVAFIYGVQLHDKTASNLAHTSAVPNEEAQQNKLLSEWAQLPLYFEEHTIKNLDGAIHTKQYLARGLGYSLGISADMITLMPPNAEDGHAINMRFVGADKTAPVGQDIQEGKINYLTGNQPEQWHTDIPTFASVQQDQIYPGIDVRFYGNQGQLEYDFIVAPNSDVNQVKLAFDGVDKLDLDLEGNLLLHTSQGVIQQNKPHLYQEIDGKRHIVDGQYQLLADNHVGFQIKHYNQNYALVIDPVLVYSSYIGGDGADRGPATTVDEFGYVYVLGTTDSVPVLSDTTFQVEAAGKKDLFLVKFDPETNALVFATYLGGTDDDFAGDIVVGSRGRIYIVGMTQSTDFPILTSIQPEYGGGTYDTFLTNLDRSGARIYFSTYLGGNGSDEGSDIVIDTESIYVTGSTTSNNFPTLNAVQTTRSGDFDAFVTKYSIGGRQLQYSTYIGGAGREKSHAITVDSRGHASITGETTSLSSFPDQKGNPDEFSFLAIEDSEPEELWNDNGFEKGFDSLDLSSSRVTGSLITDEAIKGNQSVLLEFSDYGRVLAGYSYPWGTEVYGKALQIHAKTNIPEGNNPKTNLEFCSVVYYYDGREESCQAVPATHIGNVTVDVVLDLDPTRKINRVFHWIQLGSSGPFNITIDDLHLVLYKTITETEPALASTVALTPSVDTIVGVYPAPGSTDIDPENASLILKYASTADYKWTDQKFLTIHDLETGEQVFTIDPDNLQAQQGLTSFTVKLEPGILKKNSHYGVSVDRVFAVVNAPPWKSGEITKEQWTFKTKADQETVPLAQAVNNIIGVYPAPGSKDIDPNNTTLILQYDQISDYTWTVQRALTIHDLDTGEQVFAIDPDNSHSQQGLTSFTLKLDAGILKKNHHYGVTVDYQFAVINKGPWKSGAIVEGQWHFTTGNQSGSGETSDTDPGDVFVTQLSASGQSIHFSKHLGGNGYDVGLGIAVDNQDNIVIVGSSRKSIYRSVDYPLKNALQTTREGESDGVITSFSGEGELLFSSYFGGNKADVLNNVAIDADNNVFVIGTTESTSGLALIDPVQSELNNGLSTKSDAYVAKLNAGDYRPLFASYLGGENDDSGFDLAIDGSDIYIIGDTASDTDFPIKEAYQSVFGGGNGDVFISKIDTANHHPEITSTPIITETLTKQYHYKVEATDSDDDVLSYSLLQAPAGMTINAEDGQIIWLADLMGSHTIEVKVSDGHDGFALQNYTLVISDEALPLMITSTPVTDAIVGVAYQYDVNSNKDNNSVLRYSWSLAPPGLTIDQTTGVINWLPTSDGEFTVLVKVDSLDSNQSTTQSFKIIVAKADNTKPVITLTSFEDGTITNRDRQSIMGSINEPATLTINGQSIPLYEGNEFRHRIILSNGRNTFELSATDAANNTTTQIINITLVVSKPIITIDSYQSPVTTRQATQIIKGKVDGADNLTINGQVVVLDNEQHFSHSVVLKSGANTINVTATDLAGNQSTKELSYHLDNVSPVINITSLPDNLLTNQSIQSITGTLSELATLQINGQLVTVTGDNRFNVAITLLQGSNDIILEAVDGVGNTTSNRYTIELDTDKPTLTITSHQDGFKTKNTKQIIVGHLGEAAKLTINGVDITPAGDDTFSHEIDLIEGENSFTVVVTDTANNSVTTMLTLTLDSLAPTISIITPQHESITDQAQHIISGSVDESATLTINGESVEIVQDNQFQHHIILVEGINNYSLVATDNLGNEKTQNVAITLDSGGALLISIATPSQDSVTNTVSQTISGRLNLAGSSLSIDGLSVTVEPDNRFSVDVTLQEGANNFTLEAINNQTITTQDLSVELDTINPIITVTLPAETTSTSSQTQFVIKGLVSEKAVLTINDEVLAHSGSDKSFGLGNKTNNSDKGLAVDLDRNTRRYSVSGEVKMGGENAFSHTVSLSQGENTIVINARDEAGNTATKTVTITK
mgnify:CR=1 FL=1